MATATKSPQMSAADRLAHDEASYVRRPAMSMSDDRWNPLFGNKPEACRVHRCWADQCPVGSHAAVAGGEA
ncbi:hypothetical protein AB0M57_04555 [Streptomyces sp. NPDC051597]|uniref:hypothetical protein n=1 Tax=Streptomyces sp. NPDC051597 TaxID=3155049 RepID=UPI0034302849